MTFQWTEIAVDELKRLHPDKTMSYSMIASLMARKFGGELTRNAIVGKACRLGLEKRGKAVAHPNNVRKPRGPYKGRSEYCRPRIVKMPATAPLQDLGQHDQTIPESQRKTLLELTDTTCRWMVGHPGEPDAFFCGGPSDLEGGGPYCPFHTSIAYHPAKPANRYAFRG